MNKCLKILLTLELKEGYLQNFIQRHAREHSLEGVVQPALPNKVKVIICGEKDQVDLYVDALHKELAEGTIKDIEIEPYSKDRDYRGVFRVIE